MEKLEFETYIELVRTLHEAGFSRVILDFHHDTADIYIDEYWINIDKLADIAEDLNFKICPASYDGKLMMRMRIIFDED